MLVLGLSAKGYQVVSANSISDNKDAAWAEAADLVGGVFSPGQPGAFEQTSRMIETTVDGIEVDCREDVDLLSNNVLVKTRAHSGGPEHLRLRLSPSLELEEASDETCARAWLNEAVMGRLAEGLRYRIEGGWVEATRPSRSDISANDLVATITAVAALCDGRGALVEAFRAVVLPHGGQARLEDGGWASAEAEIDGIPVRLEVKAEGEPPQTVVVARRVGRKAAPGAGEGITETLPGIVTDVEQLRAAIGTALAAARAEADPAYR